MAHSSGFKFDAIAPRSKFYQGPFGRICPELAPWEPEGTIKEQDAYFLQFARENMVERPGLDPAEIAGDNSIIAELDQEFGSQVPAGYTYFGQFIDHDITFDPTALMMRRTDPNGLLNFRTPRLDLDCVYGRGPSDQPYLYDNHPDRKGKFLIGKVVDPDDPDIELRDLPRNSQGRALIGDMRNDENSMVSQLQLAFLLAHNELVDRAEAAGMSDAFGAAQRTLRWLYQHIVWNDFLRRITADQVYKAALKLVDTPDGRKTWKLGLKDVYNWKHQPFMPVEFAGAAYRFGHSMVRNSYQTNHPHRGFGSFAPIFDNTTDPRPEEDDIDDLRGFRRMKKENVIQWDWFLPMTSSQGPFPQLARKIDTKLANALLHLHEGGAGVADNVLAFRNLKRGVMMGLPSGLAMADKFCIRKAALQEGDPESLWFYLLKEAETVPGANRGQMLGRMGSVIVCAVFAGLLKGDPCSYVNVDPCWTPNDDPLLRSGEDNVDDDSWTLASIIRLSGLPVDTGDVEEQS
ncbi:MAG: peroxidase family protein [Pseudomonadota bacterium]